MIVFDVYEDDKNDILKNVQHDCYMNSVGSIFIKPKLRFIQADAILQSKLPIIKQIHEIESIDHRILQDAHDIIAAAYRHQYDDGGQLNLFRQDQKLEDYYTCQWLEWYNAKILELIEDPDFVRFAVFAVLHGNTKTGDEFEHRLCEFLVVHFGMEDWRGDIRYLTTYPPMI